MGQEIPNHHFSPQDFERFRAVLEEETRLLGEWFSEGGFERDRRIAGCEIEVWLVDENARPTPVNAELLASIQDDKVVPELSRFNIELNTEPLPLEGSLLSAMAANLDATLAHCDEIAQGLSARLAMIGILPTVREADLTVANMSDQERYRALNEQVLRMRRGMPLRLDIQGRERLQTTHQDVMLEAATTSFQLHLQLDPREAVRAYNAAVLVSAPMVAATANAPFLFGRDLWDETRIPLFEQSVADWSDSAAQQRPHRVSLGSGYVQGSMFELFRQNLDQYPVMLPVSTGSPDQSLAALRLHNGTIWRWNRPLIGFDAAGRPHLRIEHRVMPAGPTVADAVANAALFYGVLRWLVDQRSPPELRLPFQRARENFYSAARHGLSAALEWLDGHRGSAQVLLLEMLLPAAREGLLRMEFDRGDVDHYLGIVEQRVRSGHNGAAWLRAYRARHDCGMDELTMVYMEQQRTRRPVHEWAV